MLLWPKQGVVMDNTRRWVISMRLFLSLSIFSPVSLIHAQEKPAYEPEKNWEQICQRAKSQPLVPMQPSGPLSASELRKCDETALYYGLGEEPNDAAALQCGWFQRAHPQHSVGNMFYGPGVLTMLYANGKGVPRDYDLAIRFACESDWSSEAEFGNRIGHLEYLGQAHSESATFDLCDDITSGLSMGACTSIRTRHEDVIRERKIVFLRTGLSPAANNGFPALEAAETAFEDARAANEVDLSGTARAEFELEEQARLRDQFVINLQRFGKGDIPTASSADLSLLDQELNEVYQQIQHSRASKWQFGTINPEGIRETERKWVSLADAWSTFAQTAYPNLSPSRVRAQLIRLRLHQLRSLKGN